MVYDYDRSKVAEEETPTTTITIEVRDRHGETVPAILKALHFLKWCGDIGTSQSLQTDMNGKGFLHFDGDGSNQIDVIKVDGKEVKPSKKDVDEFTNVTR